MKMRQEMKVRLIKGRKVESRKPPYQTANQKKGNLIVRKQI